MKRAFSLLEVLVAGFLGLMALLVLTQVLIQVMRSSGKACKRPRQRLLPCKVARGPSLSSP
jgi:Tfp pilus assembly protein PilV